MTEQKRKDTRTSLHPLTLEEAEALWLDPATDTLLKGDGPELIEPAGQASF